MSNEVGKTFLLKKEDIFDRRFSNPEDFKTFIAVQRCSYFNDKHPCQGTFPRQWKSWEEVTKEVRKNGITDPIKVLAVITDKGKKFKIVGNSILLGAAMLAGLNEFLAIEVIQGS